MKSLVDMNVFGFSFCQIDLKENNFITSKNSATDSLNLKIEYILSRNPLPISEGI